MCVALALRLLAYLEIEIAKVRRRARLAEAGAAAEATADRAATAEAEPAPEGEKAPAPEVYEGATAEAGWADKPAHPLLVKRAEKRAKGSVDTFSEKLHPAKKK